MAASQTEIHVLPNDSIRLEIGKRFFGSWFDEKRGLEDFKQYFDHYDQEINHLRVAQSPERWQTTGLAATTHQQILSTVDLLRNNRNARRPQLRTLLEQIFPNAPIASLNRTIDVAIRLWLMVNLREEQFHDLGLHRPCRQWNDDDSLCDFLHSLFPESKWQLTAKESRIDPDFTAQFMAKVCGLTLEWTTSLEDHLRLDRKKSTLWIFPYKNVLEALRADPACNTKSSPLLPNEMLKETFDSLDLLFPFECKDTQRLLRREGQTFQEMGPFDSDKFLSLADFNHWRDRLLELYQEIYLSPPASIRQLWHDRRDPTKFWTFWIALIILALTFVSAITGIVSMVASIVQAWFRP